MNTRGNATTNDDQRWAAVLARDAAADGTFFYSVRTTGVYCRPSCASRRANPANVRFHATAADAEAAGFRPCRRCRPDAASSLQERAAIVTRACRAIESADHVPSLAELAAAAGLSPWHFHRVFRDVTGLTPRRYAAARRSARVQGALRRSTTVTEAIYEAGFQSSARFYAMSNQALGMTPRDYRAGGAGAVVHFAVGDCSLGSVLVARTDKGICAILLGDDAGALVEELQERFPRAELVGGDATFDETVARVVAFVDAPAGPFDLPIDVRGTAFQQRVWRALQDIPPGQTVSYAELAARIGEPRAVRAVAHACASNPVAVVIPCHRVVRRDGGLAGYRWGIDRKRRLLEKERT